MLAKRIIPCLDIKNGRTVKGVHFKGLRDAGDPVSLASRYAQQGADELVFLDISATLEQRSATLPLVQEVAKELDIPFTVGGGISKVHQVEALLKNGADKIAVNSAAVHNPQLINALVDAFGSQCIVVAVDAKIKQGDWMVHVAGGTVPTPHTLWDWCRELVDRGAGELLFTSMDHDGTKNGFANKTLSQLSETLSVPIIASGGAGKQVHFKEAFVEGKADAALASSVFHFDEIRIPDLKHYLKQQNITIR